MDSNNQINTVSSPLLYFQALHKMPELSGQEKETSRYIAQRLRSFDLEVNCDIDGSTAVVAILRGREPGPVLALRADMDALPFVGADGKSCAIHACGHDAHSAMLLATAQRIAAEGALPCGEIRFIFQPAEELATGARMLLKSGILEGVDGIVGIHLRSRQEAELHEATPCLCHGATGLLRARIIGSNAHAAQPHQGVNAIDAAALTVMAINAIRVDPQVPHSAKVTGIVSHSSAVNIIPADADISVDLRAQSNPVMKQLLEKVSDAVHSSAACVGAKAELATPSVTAAAEPDKRMTELAQKAMEGVVEQIIPVIRTSGGEDFHFFSSIGHIPSAFIGLGCGMISQLHKPDMSFDLTALEDGTQILCNFVKLFFDNRADQQQ